MTAWLLTWLWQGSALAAGAAVVLRCAPQRNAATRHVILLFCLFALAWLGWAASPYGVPYQYGGLTPVLVRGSDPVYVPSAPEVLVGIFLGFWAVVASVRLLRVRRGLRDVYTVRARCRAFPRDVESRLPLWLEAKARGRRCELMICDAVGGATVLGFQNPCIAIPAMLVDALTAHDLDLVILHEHAHVQRRDDWSRLAQTMLCSVLWLHPAALFLSRALKRESEMACDERVVARTGSPKDYARCLARAADVHARMRSSGALAPALIGSRHELVRRVDRVLAIHEKAPHRVSMANASITACAMITLSVPLHVVRFGEIAEIVFPVDQVQRVQPVQPVVQVRVRQVEEVQEVQRVHETRRVRGVQAPQQVGGMQQARGIERLQSRQEAQQSRSLVSDDALVAPGALTARVVAYPSIPAAFIASVAPETTPAERQPNPWKSFAAPAVEIATNTRKASVGVAQVFSRAGLSVARSF